MKKNFLAILLAGAMGVTMAGCGQSGNNTPAKSGGASGSANNAAGDTKKISVIVKTTASEYWSYVVAGAKQYSIDNPGYSVDVVGASSETAYDEQMNIIETNMSSGEYSGFVIAPLQADTVATQIANSEVPIIAVDTKIESPKVLSFVGTGNEEAAKSGGEAAVEAAKAAGWTELNAIAISGVQGDSTASARLAGYKDGVNAAGGTFLEAETQYADAVADKAYASMEAIIQNHPKGVAIIVCNNDDMAIAAAKAAAGNPNYEKTIFVGFDGIQSACEAILKGEETMSVAQNAYDMGYKAVEACVKAINGETIETFIDSGSKIITADNAQEQLDSLKGYIG